MKRWLLKRTKINTKVMAEELGVSETVAAVIANRGIAGRREANAFIYGDLDDLRDPYLMLGMKEGVEIIKESITKNKKIAVYGDYDVDGVMSTTILFKTLKYLGGNALYYIPHRQRESYGLNFSAVERLSAENVEVLFTCDNGIAALAEVKRAKELGMTVVILDHHEPGFRLRDDKREDILPEADAIIDPKQSPCNYPFKQFCAGGLAYKFSMTLLKVFEKADKTLERELLTFAAVATVCDIVDVLDENRIIIKAGLKEIDETENIGLKALIEETGLKGRKITEYHIGFIIGPCINATGRLSEAWRAVELFCENDEQRAREAAALMAGLNEERKSLTAAATDMITAEIEKGEALNDKVLVLYGKDIHESVAGIVAGRIKDRYYRPTILITKGEDEAKGSGRSIPAYHLFNALYENNDLFTRFGGHAMAAGLSLPEENIPVLRERLNKTCTLTEEEMTPVIRVERKLLFSEIDISLAKQLRLIEPFGKENPTPIFASVGVRADRISLIGKNRDIMRFSFSQEGCPLRLNGVSFDGCAEMRRLLSGLYDEEECDKMINGGAIPEKMDIAYEIDIDTYNGRNIVQLMVKDFRLSK